MAYLTIVFSHADTPAPLSPLSHDSTYAMFSSSDIHLARLAEGTDVCEAPEWCLFPTPLNLKPGTVFFVILHSDQPIDNRTQGSDRRPERSAALDSWIIASIARCVCDVLMGGTTPSSASNHTNEAGANPQLGNALVQQLVEPPSVQLAGPSVVQLVEPSVKQLMGSSMVQQTGPPVVQLVALPGNGLDSLCEAVASKMVFQCGCALLTVDMHNDSLSEDCNVLRLAAAFPAVAALAVSVHWRRYA